MLANGNWLPREQVATSGGDASAVLKDGMQVRMYSSTGNFTAIYQYVAVKNSLKNIKMFVFYNKHLKSKHKIHHMLPKYYLRQ